MAYLCGTRYNSRVTIRPTTYTYSIAMHCTQVTSVFSSKLWRALKIHLNDQIIIKYKYHTITTQVTACVMRLPLEYVVALKRAG